MPYKGQKISNPRTGEYIEFVETAKETNGAYSRIKVKLIAGGFKPVMHLHTTTDETFVVLGGRLTYILNNEVKEIGPGSSVTLPKGKAHTHYNNGSEELIMYQSFAPSFDVDIFLENLFNLDAEGKVPKGQPAFLQLMVWGKTLRSKSYIASVPIGVQKWLTYILAPVGRLMGYKAVYKKYSGYNA